MEAEVETEAKVEAEVEEEVEELGFNQSFNPACTLFRLLTLKLQRQRTGRHLSI